MNPTAAAGDHICLPHSGSDARVDGDVKATIHAIREARRVAQPRAHDSVVCWLPPLRGWYPPLKRYGDCALAFVLLIVALPIVLAAGLLVKLTTRGPIFYRQVRLGKNGRPFLLIKLRTMKHEAEAETGPAWSTANDTRITAIGSRLRQTHLDELPQLWNVLRGEMSLVGPRPERPEFVERLDEQVPFYRERMSVRPGITGLAQLRLPPDSNLDSVRRKIVHDVYYARHTSPLLDLKLLLLTVGRLVSEICRAGWASLVLPRSDDIEHGFREAVGLEGSAAIPLRVPVVSVSALDRDAQTERLELRACAE